jgi:sugar phosphate isomerase/epimerase
MMFAQNESVEAIHDAIRAIQAEGLDGVELPLTQELISQCIDLAADARNRGLEVISSTVLPHGSDIAAEDKEEQKRGLEFLIRAIDSAARIDSHALGGVIHQPSRLLPDDARTPARRARMTQALTAAAIHAEEVGVQLAVEPTSRFMTSEINTVAEALQIIEEVDASLGLVLDTYHLAGEEADPVAAISEGLSAATFIQVNESTRGRLGEGTMDWPKFTRVLQDRHYCGWLSFESFPIGTAWAKRAFTWRDLGSAHEIVQSVIFALGLQH